MVKDLDLQIFKAGSTRTIIGQLTQDVINFLNLNRKPGNIYLWSDRFKYIDKHKHKFQSDQDYFDHIKKIPEIINSPDYIGLHPKDSSIQYIKRINKIMLVGIRIKPIGDLNLRSVYPITDATLNNYLMAGTCWKFK